MLLQPSSLTFTVKRHPPELVTPAKPTPRELKLLSDLDDQNGLRAHVPLVHFYRYQPLMAGKDPVQVIREALAKTLVFYYPFAGRLREGPKGKLMVDCTGEGVMFIEADADVTLEQFGNDLLPPIPCFDGRLLYNVPGSDGITGCPLLLIQQVTRLKCGGFIFAYRVNHTMTDASGLSQFLKDLAEIALGAPNPSILPVWRRELLCARDPPRVTCIHREYQRQLLPNNTKIIFEPYHRSFFFGPIEIAAIRALLPHHLAHQSTSYEVLTAYLWHCRTKALHWQNPDQEVSLLGIIDANYRHGFNPPLPNGFYGNTIVCPAAITTAGELCSQPLGYALELVKKAKDEATEEYVRSVVDLMVIKGRPSYVTNIGTFMVSDLSKAAFGDVDFGWGKAVYAGLPKCIGENNEVSHYVRFTNSKGEQGRVVLICLPVDAMKRFEKVLEDMLKTKNDNIKLM